MACTFVVITISLPHWRPYFPLIGLLFLLLVWPCVVSFVCESTATMAPALLPLRLFTATLAPLHCHFGSLLPLRHICFPDLFIYSPNLLSLALLLAVFADLGSIQVLVDSHAPSTPQEDQEEAERSYLLAPFGAGWTAVGSTEPQPW